MLGAVPFAAQRRQRPRDLDLLAAGAIIKGAV